MRRKQQDHDDQARDDIPSPIAEHDPGFASVYLEEIRYLVPLLTRGNARLQERATTAVGL